MKESSKKLEFFDFKKVEIKKLNKIVGGQNTPGDGDAEAPMTREQYHPDGSTGSGSDTYIGFD